MCHHSAVANVEFDLELVSIDMGYGHLRPAFAISDFLGGQAVRLADLPPLASEGEQVLWQRARRTYEALSQAGRFPVAGRLLGETLQFMTNIPPLYPRRDLSRPTLGTKLLSLAKQQGLGAGLAEHLRDSRRPLLTTFYAPAVLSDLRGCEPVYCVVTDSDVNRVWAPEVSRHTGIVYLAPTERVRRRLKTYGVPGNQVLMTGFPLPHELVGGLEGNALRRNLKRRLAALDPKGRFVHACHQEIGHFLGELDAAGKPPHLVFAVGGAGAQVELAGEMLPSLAPRLRRNKLKLTLVAGIRPEVKAHFERAIERCDLSREAVDGTIDVLFEEDHASYFRQFNKLMASTDILWTKPSELSFFAALGIPLILSPPVGSHERYNRRWVETTGAGVRQANPRLAGEWLFEMLKDGMFAGAAWSGYMRMPKFGLYRTVEEALGRDVLMRRLAELSHESAAPVESAVSLEHGAQSSPNAGSGLDFSDRAPSAAS